MRSGLSLSLPAVASLDHDPLCVVDPISDDPIVERGFWPKKDNQCRFYFFARKILRLTECRFRMNHDVFEVFFIAALLSDGRLIEDRGSGV
jgi:hypothetical protein